MDLNSEPTWITPRAASSRSGVSVRTIHRWIAEGRLNAVRVGPRLIRVDAASVEAIAKPIA